MSNHALVLRNAAMKNPTSYYTHSPLHICEAHVIHHGTCNAGRDRTVVAHHSGLEPWHFECTSPRNGGL